MFCFCVFLVHPTVASVLLSASVERFDVSRMRDFLQMYLSISMRKARKKRLTKRVGTEMLPLMV